MYECLKYIKGHNKIPIVLDIVNYLDLQNYIVYDSKQVAKCLYYLNLIRITKS
jgi:hypothetical protein